MKTKKKLLGAITSFAAASACLVGGTYAWFVISSTAEASTSGTVASIDNVNIGIKTTKNLQHEDNLGIYTDTDFLTFAALDLIPDADYTAGDAVGEFIYWAKGTAAGEKAGKFKTGVIEFIAVVEEYSNYFTPVTTGKYVDGTAIKLVKGLDAVLGKTVRTVDGSTVDGYSVAEKTDYMEYTLVFETPEPSSKIHLRSANTAVTVDLDKDVAGNVGNSIRVGFDSTTGKSIFNPSKTDAAVTMAVGGRMDLNGDQVWDYYELGGNKFEIYYGEADLITTATTSFATPTTTAANIYGVTYKNAAEVVGADVTDAPEGIGTNTNFLGTTPATPAKSLAGVFTFAAAPEALTQAAHGIGHYLPGQTALLTTDALTKRGELTVTTWVEGWDADCQNNISTDQFGLTLGFVAVLG